MKRGSLDFEKLVEELLRISEDHSIPIEKITVRVFSRLSPYGAARLVNRKGALPPARLEAMKRRTEAYELHGGGPSVPPVDALPPNHYVKGVSSLVGPEGELRAQWVKTAKKRISLEEEIQNLLIELPPKITPKKKASLCRLSSMDEDLLAVYPLGDPHLGMLSWGQETLDHSTDLKKGAEILVQAVQELVRHYPRAETALIVNLGDFVHSDNYEATTLRSRNVLDTDSRWSKIIRVGFDTMIALIDEALLYHEKVHVINEIGNHDDRSSVMLTIGLDRYYSNNPRVSFDLSPARFHYFRFHRNLIGVTHGHTVKEDELESIMAYDRAVDFAETDAQNRFWYVGHIHTSKKKDFRNCTVERFRSLSPLSAWASGSGYRGGRDLNRIILHKEYGEMSRSIISAKYLEDSYLSSSSS